MPVIIDVFGAHGSYREILLSEVIEIGSEVMRGPPASHQGDQAPACCAGDRPLWSRLAAEMWTARGPWQLPRSPFYRL